MVLSLSFSVIYFTMFSVFVMVYIRPIWTKMLVTIKRVVLAFWFLIAIDLIQIVVFTLLVL